MLGPTHTYVHAGNTPLTSKPLNDDNVKQINPNTKGTLPATMEYASPLQKRRLDTFGLLYGCHTCGRRQVGSSWVADRHASLHSYNHANPAMP